MNRKLTVLVASAVALLLSACNSLTSIVGVAMDTPEAWSKVQEIIDKNVDASTWKLVSLEMNQEPGKGKELNNDLYYCSVVMVDKDGAAWQQAFFLNGIVGDLSRYREGTDFSTTPALDVKTLTPEAYAKQIEEAKKLIPTDYKFECVETYSLVNMVEEGTPKGRCNFNITEKDAKPVSNAGRTVTEYYEVPFVVDEQGVVTMLEE